MLQSLPFHKTSISGVHETHKQTPDSHAPAKTVVVITTKAALQRDVEDNRLATGRNIYVTYESAEVAVRCAVGLPVLHQAACVPQTDVTPTPQMKETDSQFVSVH